MCASLLHVSAFFFPLVVPVTAVVKLPAEQSGVRDERRVGMTLTYSLTGSVHKGGVTVNVC